MKTRIGKHLGRREAAHGEPSPLTGLREILATGFAADIAAVTPMVVDLMGERAKRSVRAEQDLLVAARTMLSADDARLAGAIEKAVRERFEDKLGNGDGHLSKTGRYTLADLSLVDEAQLRLDIALDNCAARMKEQAATALFALTARLCVLLGRETIPDSANPVHPRILARSLLDALETLGFPVTLRAVAFEAYSTALLYIAPDLLGQASQVLEARGVLVGFSGSYGRPVQREPTKTVQAPRTAAPAAASQLDAGALSKLLERLLSGQPELSSSAMSR